MVAPRVERPVAKALPIGLRVLDELVVNVDVGQRLARVGLGDMGNVAAEDGGVQ